MVLTNPLPVCWSLKRETRGGGGLSAIHWARETNKTGCGLTTDGLWDFWGHRLEEGDVGPTCKHCLSAMKRLGISFGAKAMTPNNSSQSVREQP